jgi:DNA-binding transcriptional LysR family regulator
LDHSDTVPLVVHPEGCQYRQRIVRALSEAGRDWYVAFQSPDIAELQSAVEKSLGVSALTLPTKTDRMSVLNSEDGFLRLERIRVGLYVSDKTNEDKSAKVLNCLRESLGRSTLIDS